MTYMHTCILVCLHIYILHIYAYLNTCIHICIHAYLHTYQALAYLYACILSYLNTCTVAQFKISTQWYISLKNKYQPDISQHLGDQNINIVVHITAPSHFYNLQSFFSFDLRRFLSIFLKIDSLYHCPLCQYNTDHTLYQELGNMYQVARIELEV